MVSECMIFVPGDHRDCMWCNDAKRKHEFRECSNCDGWGAYQHYDREVRCEPPDSQPHETCGGYKTVPLRKDRWSPCGECEGTGLHADVSWGPFNVNYTTCPSCDGLRYKLQGREQHARQLDETEST